MIAFLGTGLLGANFIRALRSKGHDVQVWNRSPAKAQALEQYGAKAFAEPADAVLNAQYVHITLSDDAVVDDVLEQAREGLSNDVIIIDHTTTSPALTAERVKRWKERGIRFLHAPVFMGPPNALASTGTMMASGDNDLFDTVRAHLEPMTGKLVYLGGDPARAAGIKLLGNQFIVMIVASLSDTLSLARAMEIPASDVTDLFDFFNPGAGVPVRLRRMLEADYDNPSWTLNMARKDIGLMLSAATDGNETLAALPGVAAAMDALIAGGHGAEDWTVVAKNSVIG